MSAFRFTSEETSHIQRAIRFLLVTYQTMDAIARACGASRSRLTNALSRRPSISPALVFRLANLAGAPVDDVVSGKWPPPGTCPYCGRPGPAPVPKKKESDR